MGRESEIVQEQIVSSAISRVMSKKGQKFRLKLMGAGGTRGMSKEVTIGAKGEEKEIMPIEVFKEIKKELVKSKNKMEKLCSIMRKHKVKMSPRIKDKLRESDHILDEEYETIQIKFEKSVSEDVPIRFTQSRRGKTSELPKITKKITKKVYEVRNLTILKNPKNFLERLAEERYFWP